MLDEPSVDMRVHVSGFLGKAGFLSDRVVRPL